MITVYGIPNCDKVRDVRKQLDRQGLAHRFHDVRADGLTPGQVRLWMAELGADALLNRRSATWRQLPAAERSGLTTARAVALILAHPTLLQRPLLDIDGALRIGYDEAACARSQERRP